MVPNLKGPFLQPADVVDHPLDDLVVDLAHLGRALEGALGGHHVHHLLDHVHVGPEPYQAYILAPDQLYTDYTQGSLEETSLPLDFAIEGEGFFAIDTGNGVAGRPGR